MEGKMCSPKTNLKREGIGFHAYIVHNCIWFGRDTIPVDVESILIKIFGHIHIFTFCVESLKTFYEYA